MWRVTPYIFVRVMLNYNIFKTKRGFSVFLIKLYTKQMLYVHSF